MTISNAQSKLIAFKVMNPKWIAWMEYNEQAGWMIKAEPF